MAKNGKNMAKICNFDKIILTLIFMQKCSKFVQKWPIFGQNGKMW